MQVFERPDNWPFQPNQTWGTNPDDLTPWDRMAPYVTEEEVFAVWAAMRRIHGGARVSEWWVMKASTYDIWRCLSALSVLRDAGWVLQWGSTDRGPFEAMTVTYQALAPDEIRMSHADMPLTDEDKYWLSVLVSAIVGVLIVGLAFLVQCA